MIDKEDGEMNLSCDSMSKPTKVDASITIFMQYF